jgi:hypothetical protein
MLERKRPINNMSEKQRQKRAAAGDTTPFSTLSAGAPLNRAAEGGRMVALDRKPAKNTGPSAKVLVAVKARSGGRCEFPYLCPLPSVHTHHRRPRRMGGSSDPATNLPSNLLRLCLAHHEWAEANRAEALRLGLLVHANADPAHVPVLHAVHGWVLLTPAGGFTAYSPNHDHTTEVSA